MSMESVITAAPSRKKYYQIGIMAKAITMVETIISSMKKIKNKDFDCILGLSGGIDSSYLLHLVVKDLILGLLFSMMMLGGIHS